MEGGRHVDYDRSGSRNVCSLLPRTLRLNASLVAEERAAGLRRSGDAEGERVWTKVKRQIEMQGSHEAAA